MRGVRGPAWSRWVWMVQLCVGVMLAGSHAVAADPALIAAVRRGDAMAVRHLLARGADVNSRRGDGATALHWAVHAGDGEMVGMLLDAGADVNAITDTGVTPAYLACTNRDPDMLLRLLESGADPNVSLPSGETILMECARTGAARGVEALIASGADVNAAEGAHRQTALMWAVANRHAAAARALIEGGADVQARSRVYAQTVTRGTNASARREGNLIEQRGGSTALLFAARVGDVESARALLEAGADVHDALPNGTSALVVAAHSGHGELARLLVEAGADPNDMGAGYAPLHAAVLRGDAGLVRELLSRGADPNAVVLRGMPLRRTSQDFAIPEAVLGATPYALAARFLEVDLMRILAEGGASPFTPLADGTTPLMAAIGMGAPGQADRRGLSVLDGGIAPTEADVVRAVDAAVRLGSELDAVNEDGETALHGAATQGYNDVIRLLVDLGAEINVRNNRGQTPLSKLTGGRQRGPNAFVNTYAERDRTSTVRLLRELGGVE